MLGSEKIIEDLEGMKLIKIEDKPMRKVKDVERDWEYETSAISFFFIDDDGNEKELQIESAVQWQMRDVK